MGFLISWPLLGMMVRMVDLYTFGIGLFAFSLLYSLLWFLLVVVLQFLLVLYFYIPKTLFLPLCISGICFLFLPLLSEL